MDGGLGRAMKLQKREIDALACPPERADMLVFDDDLTGFALRVTRAGAKTFLFQYRRGAAVRRLRLGEYGDITPAQARKLAERALGQVAEGGDPAAERKAVIQAEAEAKKAAKIRAEADAYTLRMLVDEWERLSLSHRRDRYRLEATRALRFGLAELLEQPAHEIDRTRLQRALDGMTRPAAPAPRITASKSARAGQQKDATVPRYGPPVAEGVTPGETMARRTRAYGHACYAWGVKRGLVPANPFAGTVAEGRNGQRDRVLTDSEIGEIWQAAGLLGWPWGPFFRFLLLTLQREAETAGMNWAELPADLAVWELPGHRTKNGRPHVVHLAEEARAILRAAPRVAMQESPGRLLPSPLVFTTTGTTPVSGFAHAKLRLDAEITKARAKVAAESGADPVALVPWRIHDFRRAGVTVMARLGVQIAVADKILNHSAGAIRGVAAIYQRHDFMGERKAALETWAAHVVSAAQAVVLPKRGRRERA